MVSKILRRRRVFRLIAFLGVAGVIFVFFQIFSVEMLQNSDKNSRMQLVARKPVVLPGNSAKPGCLDNPRNCDTLYNASNAAVIQGENKLFFNQGDQGDTFGIQNQHRVPRRQDHFILDNDVVKKDSQESMENDDVDKLYEDDEGDVPLEDMVVDESKLPRGVPRTMAQPYLPDAENQFMCLQSKEKIPFAHVNDDYCDCADSSDEPGTSACPDSKFYCRFQLAGPASDLKWVFSSRVNDGICDCCDGSDEWLNVRLDDRLLLNDGVEHYGIRQGPCDNRCSQLQAAAKRQSAVQRQGANLKRQYINSLTANIKTNKLYGSDGAYYMLAQECFKRSADKYQYHVCPFKEITQSSKVIGKGGQWMQPHKLKMSNGDSSQCPGMRKRLSIIEFECGLQNEILSIQETEVCEYTFRFSTPAAC